MRAACGFALLVAALVAAAPAHAEQAPPEQIVANIAAGLCKAEKAKLGDAGFTEKYGSDEACAQEQAAKAEQIAREAIAGCRSQAEPGSAPFKACVQERAKALVQAVVGGAGGAKGGAEPPAELVANIADAICKAEQKKLGAAKFTQKYGSHAGCKEAVQAQAKALAKEAGAKCKSAADKKACVKEFVQSKLKQQGGKSQAVPAELVANAANGLCTAEQRKLGDERFAEKYGSMARCRERMKERAEAIARDAGKACKDADDKKACVKAELQKRIKGGGKGK